MVRRRRRAIDDDVPRLPRGKGLVFSTAAIVRIVMVATALIALIVLQKPCSHAIGHFVTSFDDKDAGVPRPADAAAAPAIHGVSLKGMSQAEMEQAVQQELDRARAAAADGGVPTDAGAPADAGAPVDAP